MIVLVRGPVARDMNQNDSVPTQNSILRCLNHIRRLDNEKLAFHYHVKSYLLKLWNSRYCTAVIDSPFQIDKLYINVLCSNTFDDDNFPIRTKHFPIKKHLFVMPHPVLQEFNNIKKCNM